MRDIRLNGPLSWVYGEIGEPGGGDTCFHWLTAEDDDQCQIPLRIDFTGAIGHDTTGSCYISSTGSGPWYLTKLNFHFPFHLSASDRWVSDNYCISCNQSGYRKDCNVMCPGCTCLANPPFAMERFFLTSVDPGCPFMASYPPRSFDPERTTSGSCFTDERFLFTILKDLADQFHAGLLGPAGVSTASTGTILFSNVEVDALQKMQLISPDSSLLFDGEFDPSDGSDWASLYNELAANGLIVSISENGQTVIVEKRLDMRQETVHFIQSIRKAYPDEYQEFLDYFDLSHGDVINANTLILQLD